MQKKRKKSRTSHKETKNFYTLKCLWTRSARGRTGVHRQGGDRSEEVHYEEFRLDNALEEEEDKKEKKKAHRKLMAL